MAVATAVVGFTLRSIGMRYARRRIYTRVVGRSSVRSTTGHRARLARPGGKTAVTYNKSYTQYRKSPRKRKSKGRSYGLRQAKDLPDETPRTLLGSLSHGRGSKYKIGVRTIRKYRSEVAKRNAHNSYLHIRKRRKRRWL